MCQFTGDIQPQSCSVFRCGVKGFEQVFLHFGRNAAAVVGKQDADGVFWCRPGDDGNRAATFAAVPPCVVAKVPHDLPQVGGIEISSQVIALHIQADAADGIGIVEQEFLFEAYPKLHQVDGFAFGFVAFVERGDVFEHFVDTADVAVDDFAKRLSFFWAIGKNYFMEIAKMRAARVLWAKIVKSFGAQNDKSMALRTHSQTSGWSLTAQDPFNNIARTAMEAMGAALGHTQSLHTNALDEAIALPTDFSARIARNTQLYIQDETSVCKIIDPWGGSYYVESLTNEIIRRAWAHIQEVEALGGMAKAISTGLPKMRIEEAAARRQAQIDSGLESIVGVNKYRLEKEDPLQILAIDNTAVRQAQVERLEKLRAERNADDVRRCLEGITKAAESRDNGNLLEAAVDAARARASLGEISDAVEKVSGRFQAVIHTISGVYSSEFTDKTELERAREMADEFEELTGRRPRIFVAKMGQDGHDRGQKVIASSFADMGWDVDVGPLFQTPAETAQDAVDNDVHMVGFSSLAAGHNTLLPQLVDELKKLGRDDIMVCIGGVIPVQDYDNLYEHGAVAIFAPGTNIPEAGIKLLTLLIARAKEEAAG